MVGQIPQNDPSFHATLVSECLSRMLESPIQLSLLPWRIQTQISFFLERSLAREMVSFALGEFSSMAVGFTGLWIRMQKSLDKEEGEKTKPEAL